MRADISCHLVDLISVPSIAMSLSLRYLRASIEADSRLAGQCDVSHQCRYLVNEQEDTWRGISAALDGDRSPRQVVAFASLCWNSEANLRLARRVRAAYPDTLIVFGGNDVAHQSDWILGDGTGVDVLVNGEGETVLANVLASYLEKGERTDFRDVRGVSFRGENGQIVTTAPQPLIQRLDDIPTPFQGDAGDEIARSAALICEFSRGCPFECAFCNWGGATGTQIRRFSPDRIRQDLEYLVTHMKDGGLIYIADSNFGMTEADLEAAQILVDTVKRHNKRIYIFTNFAKNTNRCVIETGTLLFRNGLISMVTLSAQSLNTDALEIARRRYMPFEIYQGMQKEFRERGVPTYTELLIGMPGESYESFLLGIERVIESGGSPTIYTLLLLNNTHYVKPEVRARHGLRSKLMPYTSLDMSIRAETSIGHDLLSYDEWLACVGLMISVPIFHFAILRFVMERMRTVYGVGYGRMLDRLVKYFMAGSIRSHPIVRRLFLNFIETWKDQADFDADLLHSIMGEISGQFGPPHYQAVLKSVVIDVPAAHALVEELAGVLADLSESPVDAAQLSKWVAYQKTIVAALAQAAHGQPGMVDTDCEVEDLREFVGPSVLVEENGTRRLYVREKFKRYSLEDTLFQMTFGTFNTLAMFKCMDTAGGSRRDEQFAAVNAVS